MCTLDKLRNGNKTEQQCCFCRIVTGEQLRGQVNDRSFRANHATCPLD